MWWRLGQVDLSTAGLLVGCELEVCLSWELEVVRPSELAVGELIDLLLVDTFLTNARLSEVLYWD